MGRGLLVALGLVLALALPSAVDAATPPTLISDGHANRHPNATFSMPGADVATIYFSSKPDRASDGGFLQENIKALDFLTTDEIQQGRWSDESQLDPGTYYVMVWATDYDCTGQPSCIDGYSNMLPLHVEKPPQAYRAGVQVFHYSRVAYLTLRVTPLGEKLPYEVCWHLKTKRLRCASGTVDGYSWNSSADDQLSVRLRGMANRTKFIWYVGGHAVASKTANTDRR